MADPHPARQRVLFISNGHGEDSIAAEMINNLPDTVSAEAYPMIGDGKAFIDLCPIVGPRAHMPSQGWRHTRNAAAGDTSAILSSLWPSITFLRKRRKQQDRVIAIGDGVAPLLCMLAGLKIDIYLDVFKSGYAHTYNWFEKFVIGRSVTTTYCRDDMLAATLRQARLDGRSEGNVMLDCVPDAPLDMQSFRRAPLAVTLLPGSRDWTSESLTLQFEALAALSPDLKVDLFMALAGGLYPETLAFQTGSEYVAPPAGAQKSNAGTLLNGALTCHLVSGALGSLLDGSDVVLSQAGTATQQALGRGKPVITFNRSSNRPKRMADEQALMGEARILCDEDATQVATHLERLLRNPDERARLGAIGQKRLGGPGTLAAVISDLS